MSEPKNETPIYIYERKIKKKLNVQRKCPKSLWRYIRIARYDYNG